MSGDPSDLIPVPFMILIVLAVLAAVSIGTNGGDVTWITDAVTALAIPAIILGVLIALAAKASSTGRR